MSQDGLLKKWTSKGPFLGTALRLLGQFSHALKLDTAGLKIEVQISPSPQKPQTYPT